MVQKMQKVICVLQARMGSHRLPGKAMAEICGKPMIEHIITRLQKITPLHGIVLATTLKREDEILVRIAKRLGIRCFRGPTWDVLRRITRAAETSDAEIVINASGDNPLISPLLINKMLKYHIEKKADFTFMGGAPIGSTADIFSLSTLQKINLWAKTPVHREHVNAYIFENLERFNVLRVLPPDSWRLPFLRVTVDTPEDLELIREIYKKLFTEGEIIPFAAVIDLYKREPHLFQMNAHVKQLYVSDKAEELRNLRGNLENTIILK